MPQGKLQFRRNDNISLFNCQRAIIYKVCLLDKMSYAEYADYAYVYIFFDVWIQFVGTCSHFS